MGKAMKRIRLVLLILLLVSQGTWGVDNDGLFKGTDLIVMCNAYINRTNILEVSKGNYCAGFVQGISHAHALFANRNDMSKRWCEPVFVSTIQLVSIVRDYLAMHIMEWESTPPSRLVVNAFMEAFPCN